MKKQQKQNNSRKKITVVVATIVAAISWAFVVKSIIEAKRYSKQTVATELTLQRLDIERKPSAKKDTKKSSIPVKSIICPRYKKLGCCGDGLVSTGEYSIQNNKCVKVATHCVADDSGSDNIGGCNYKRPATATPR